MEKELRQASEADDPETLDSLAFRLRMKESRMRDLYRELCDKIAERGLHARNHRATQKTEARFRAINELVERHARDGIPATRRVVETEVGFLISGGPLNDRWRAARARVGMPV